MPPSDCAVCAVSCPECEHAGHFTSGVPGILAHGEPGRFISRVERCDACQRYPSDAAAAAALRQAGGDSKFVSAPRQLLEQVRSQLDDLHNGWPERELVRPLAATLAELDSLLGRAHPEITGDTP